MRLALATAALALSLSGCAYLHHVQLGEIDNRGKLKPFDIKINETGVSVGEALSVASAFAGKADGRNMGELGEMWGYFHMGPTTGKPVFNDEYAERLVHILYKECPSGKITGLVAIRETMNYPVISGEIVRITGYCRR